MSTKQFVEKYKAINNALLEFHLNHFVEVSVCQTFNDKHLVSCREINAERLAGDSCCRYY